MSWYFPGCGDFLFVYFSCVYVAQIAENAAVHLDVLKEFLKQIIKILYGIILLVHLIIIHQFSWILFLHSFLPSLSSQQFPGSWCLSLVLFVKLSPSCFLLFWRYLFILFSCIDSIHWLLKYFNISSFFFLFGQKKEIQNTIFLGNKMIASLGNFFLWKKCSLLIIKNKGRKKLKL